MRFKALISSLYSIYLISSSSKHVLFLWTRGFYCVNSITYVIAMPVGEVTFSKAANLDKLEPCHGAVDNPEVVPNLSPGLCRGLKKENPGVVRRRG
jgi:hypothetical protein